jgi:glyoxylase-like metal-dependent hydrolase (beta-lactamase superfamily II)
MIHICATCGTSFPETLAPPQHCPICEDERQYVPRSGQAWTTPKALAARHVNAWRQLEPNLFEIHTQPQFAIGQRALLLKTPDGNILWDCLSLIDEATVTLIRALGGIKAITISHPHYYSCMQDWGQAFGAHVYLHSADREWVMRPDPAIRFWDGDEFKLADGATLLRLGGHFAGAAVLHWRDGAKGRGALFSGDTVQVAPHPQRVSFLWSYPNMMPLPAATIRGIAAQLEPWPFERIYGAFAGRQVTENGSAVVQRSAARYIELLDGQA